LRKHACGVKDEQSEQRHEVGKVWREVAGSAYSSGIGRALSRASVDRLIFAERGGPRRCGRDREGVVQPRVQNSHPRRQCHLARGRGATREPIAGTLSSPCAQSAPGQGKPFVLIGDIGRKRILVLYETGPSENALETRTKSIEKVTAFVINVITQYIFLFDNYG